VPNTIKNTVNVVNFEKQTLSLVITNVILLNTSLIDLHAL